jgi:serine/threonine-protein kinase
VDTQGSGAFGTVYLAERVTPGATARVALKVSHHPWNERFNREAELLSRIRHPCVPRLIDQGHWLSSTGLPHPWLAMEWVEGIPLYAWASAFAPSSRQVLKLLAELARALAATHAVGGVHRDVKGDNALVRLEDGQGFLIDFGSCTYEGATPLTGPVFPPGTQPYRSPEAYRFALHIREAPVKIYAPKPAEDVFALGVTAYKLVTGEYPPQAEPLDPQFHVWKTDGPGPRPARELNPRCHEELSSFISRMLSRQPEARGSAHELAEALEHAARDAGPEADASLFAGQAPGRITQAEASSPPIHTGRSPELTAQTETRSRRIQVRQAPARSTHAKATPLTEVPARSGASWLVAVGVAGALVLGTTRLMETLDRREAVAQQEEQDAGTVGVGDAVLTAPAASMHAPSAGTPIAMDFPDKPLPRQVRPDANGRCPLRVHVVINGGCWWKAGEDAQDCEENTYLHKGRCYQPVYPPPRPATSDPTEARDGG